MKKPAIPVVAAALVLLGAAALAQNRQVAATQRSEWIKFNPVTSLTASSFAKPPAADLPWVRMNMPATADPAEIGAEVRAMAEFGIAGVEIGHGVGYASDCSKPEKRPGRPASDLLRIFLCGFGLRGLLSQPGAIRSASDLQNDGSLDQSIQESHSQRTVG